MQWGHVVRLLLMWRCPHTAGGWFPWLYSNVRIAHHWGDHILSQHLCNPTVRDITSVEKKICMWAQKLPMTWLSLKSKKLLKLLKTTYSFFHEFRGGIWLSPCVPDSMRDVMGEVNITHTHTHTQTHTHTHTHTHKTSHCSYRKFN